MPKGWLRESDGQLVPVSSAADALIQAITELKAEGGGTVWVHRLSCLGESADEDCGCDPIGVEVDPEEIH